MPNNAPIDVIIPTMRSAEELADLVDEIHRTAGVPVNVIVTGQPVCAAKNRNIGLDQSASDPVFMVDDDMENFPQNWMPPLIRVLEDRPNCVMVSPQVVNLTGFAMMGCCETRKEGVTRAKRKELATSCVAVRRNAIRFNEDFLGSGWEDNEFCRKLLDSNPQAEFCVCHDVWVFHRNEMKNQDYPDGPNWRRNKALYRSKWDHNGGYRACRSIRTW